MEAFIRNKLQVLFLFTTLVERKARNLLHKWLLLWAIVRLGITVWRFKSSAQQVAQAFEANGVRASAQTSDGSRIFHMPGGKANMVLGRHRIRFVLRRKLSGKSAK